MFDGIFSRDEYYILYASISFIPLTSENQPFIYEQNKNVHKTLIL